ncbi:type II toxin-antitoxin system HicB family antitoxin [Patescibacteria group bacterium]|nr:type II toxin-antitoxin system HicB family antitoxin [Patescibacteria group bacterium]MBU1885266.1 type II toxin-antitoxin system HicB family antitoxin [Patescibacteria group bacterium]
MKDAIYTYRSIIEKDGGGYHGYVPSLPGCHTQGATIEETKKNLKKVVIAMLEAMVKLKEPIERKEEYETIETISFPGLVCA